MKRTLGLGAVLAAGLWSAGPASADVIVAGGVASSKLDVDGVDYDTTITLTDTAASTVGIGTFWFAWTPGKDFMSNAPISITTPAGWAAKVTGGNANNGYAIQWVAGSSAADVAVGASLDFGFKSAETPTQLAGNSAFFPGTPETTSVVYNAAPFSAVTETFVVTPAAVPEPSTAALAALGGLGLLAARRPRRRGRRVR